MKKIIILHDQFGIGGATSSLQKILNVLSTNNKIEITIVLGEKGSKHNKIIEANKSIKIIQLFDNQKVDNSIVYDIAINFNDGHNKLQKFLVKEISAKQKCVGVHNTRTGGINEGNAIHGFFKKGNYTKRSMKRGDMFAIACSPVVQKDHQKLFNKSIEKIFVILNTVDTDYENLFAKNTLINIGRNDTAKNYEMMAKVLIEIDKQITQPINFIQIGADKNSNDGARLSSIKDNLKYINVDLRGQTTAPGENIKGSVFLTTSTYEGFPMVLLESTSHGLNVVSTLDSSKYGFGPLSSFINFVPDFNVNEYAKKVCELLPKNNSKKIIENSKKLNKKIEQSIWTTLEKLIN